MKAGAPGASFPVLDREVMVEGGAGIDLARPVDTSLAVFHDFFVIGDPAGHASDGEHDSEHLDRDTNGAHDDAAVKVDIGIELALDEIGIAEGGLFEVFGDGEQTRDFIYIENVVQANLLAAEAAEAVSQVINIGSGERISLNELLRVAGALLGVPAEADYREARPGDVRDSQAAIQRARSLLGFEPAIGFREGLAKTLASLGVHR